MLIMRNEHSAAEQEGVVFSKRLVLRVMAGGSRALTMRTSTSRSMKNASGGHPGGFRRSIEKMVVDGVGASIAVMWPTRCKPVRVSGAFLHGHCNHFDCTYPEARTVLRRSAAGSGTASKRSGREPIDVRRLGIDDVEQQEAGRREHALLLVLALRHRALQDQQRAVILGVAATKHQAPLDT